MTRNRTQTTHKASTARKPARAPAQAPAAEEARADIYQRITDRIAAAIEAGAGTWQMPWHPGADGAAPRLPVNAATGRLCTSVTPRPCANARYCATIAW